MERRRFLAATAAAGISIAGCVGGEPNEDRNGQQDNPDTQTPQTTVRDGLRVDVLETETAPEIRGTGVTGSIEADDGNLIGLVHIRVENQSETAKYLPSNFKILRDQSQYDVVSQPSLTAGPENLQWPVEGFYEGSGEIFPDVEESGWIYAELPNDIGDCRLAWNHSDSWGDGDVLSWEISFDTSSTPTAGVSKVRGPDTVESGTTATFEIVATNSGSGPYSNRLPVDIVDDGEGQGYGSDYYDFEVPPGETDTVSIDYLAGEPEEIDILVGETLRRDVTIVPQEINFGEYPSIPSDTGTTAKNLIFTDSYTVGRYDSSTTEAKHGEKFAIFVWQNESYSWSDPEFVVSGESIQPQDTGYQSITNPVNSGNVNGEVLIYAVPESTEREDITVVAEKGTMDGDFQITWSSD